MSDDDKLTVDDIVTGKVAEQLGPGVIPTRCILIVETISTEGEETLPGMRYILSLGTKPWQALGPMRSVTLKLEADDLACWQDDEEGEPP